jgi:hypothetical protein
MRAWNCAGTLVRAKGIEPVIARRGTAHGSGRGRYRWVVEQAIALLHWFRRLRIGWEVRDDVHEASSPSDAASSAGVGSRSTHCVRNS